MDWWQSIVVLFLFPFPINLLSFFLSFLKSPVSSRRWRRDGCVGLFQEGGALSNGPRTGGLDTPTIYKQTLSTRHINTDPDTQTNRHRHTDTRTQGLQGSTAEDLNFSRCFCWFYCVFLKVFCWDRMFLMETKWKYQNNRPWKHKTVGT